jgi:membrane protein YdbS with pleckstrin-like domain
MKVTVSKKYILAKSALIGTGITIFGLVVAFSTLFAGVFIIVAGILFSLLYFFIDYRLRFYFVEQEGVVTKKLFTADTVVKTPYRNITEVQEFAGPLQAFCGCGTIEITTNSGKKISWDHIQGEESIANEIQKRISNL